MKFNFKASLLLAAMTMTQPLWSADFITGHLVDMGRGEFKIQTPNRVFEVDTSETIKKSLPSLANPVYVKQSDGNPYSYEFKGQIKGDTFELTQTPTNIPGPSSLEGVLVYHEGLDQYSINGQVVEFGYTKELNHYSFDQISKQSFIGKKIIAEGHFESDVFIMQALYNGPHCLDHF